MPRFCANLSMMFTEHRLPGPVRGGGAGRVQGGGVPVPVRLCRPPRSIPGCRIRALQQVLFNMPPGDWAMGERGTACLPGRQAEFRDGVKRALDYAAVFGTKRLHCMAGLLPAGWPRGKRPPACMPPTSPGRASRPTRPACSIVIEPINHRDMPGFFLNTTGHAAAVVEAIGRDRLAHPVRHLPLPGDRGGRDQPDGGAVAVDRTYPDRRRAGPQRARERGAELGPICSSASTRSAMTAGSAANIVPPPERPPVSKLASTVPEPDAAGPKNSVERSMID